MRRSVGIVAVVGALSLAAPTAAFAQGVGDGPPVLPPAFAVISGTVKAGGEPLAGATVLFEPVGWKPGHRVTPVQTLEDGSYSVRLPAENYSIRFTAENGYAVSVWGDNNPAFLRSDVLDASKGGTFTGIDGSLEKAGVLTGSVGGPPALVTALQASNDIYSYLALFGYDEDSQSWKRTFNGFTVQADDTYTMKLLPPGNYKIQAVVNGAAVNQVSNWSDQPTGTFSREIQVGSRTGLPAVYDIQLAYVTPPGAASPIVP
jgi:hypothetical protein